MGDVIDSGVIVIVPSPQFWVLWLYSGWVPCVDASHKQKGIWASDEIDTGTSCLIPKNDTKQNSLNLSGQINIFEIYMWFPYDFE